MSKRPHPPTQPSNDISRFLFSLSKVMVVGVILYI